MSAYKPFTGAKRLRELLKDPKKLVVCPGVYDGLTARLGVEAGYDAVYMTGAGTSMSKLGWADLGLATLNDMADNASMIASLNPSIPVIADADTGYGGPVMVARTVAKYARGGVAALHIEDQIQEKRCGHLQGKEIVDREKYYSRLRAAVTARNELQSDMLIIARTDARQTYGFDEAIARLQEAVKIGVDVAFFEAMQSKEEAKRVIEIMGDTPCLLNMVPGGATPSMTVDEARELGFRIMIFPGLSIGAVIHSVRTELQYLKENGITTKASDGKGVKEGFNVCGLQDCIELDKAAGGKAYATIGE